MPAPCRSDLRRLAATRFLFADPEWLHSAFRTGQFARLRSEPGRIPRGQTVTAVQKGLINQGLAWPPACTGTR